MPLRAPTSDTPFENGEDAHSFDFNFRYRRQAFRLAGVPTLDPCPKTPCGLAWMVGLIGIEPVTHQLESRGRTKKLELG
jgi:hypothetical protein